MVLSAGQEKSGKKLTTDVDGVEWIETDDGKEPLAYLQGYTDFYGHRFAIDRSCFVPRPNSDLVVLAAMEWLKSRSLASPRLLDLGTGCGNLLLSILAGLPASATGIGIDISPGSILIAEKNRDALISPASRASFMVKDMGRITVDDIDGPIDVVLFNPPYKIKSDDTTAEPRDAFYAAGNGYAWYAAVHEIASELIVKGGCVVLKGGKGMMDNIRDIWHDWHVVRTWNDKQGDARCLVLQREP
ncbi:S-adenosyl-L-methionine-dependent methyltransferase [Gongronella butleri]|nr:S-adenosyl-L-methionine-dependent methyltransferase [Gongronella butleri]